MNGFDANILEYANQIVIGLGIVITLGIYFLGYKKTKSRQLLNCLPGVWTSLGLLGTFCAIFISLSGLSTENVTSSIGSTVAESATSSINIIDIISGLIPAFSTSIIGLVGALVTSIVARCIFAHEDFNIGQQTGNKSVEEHIYDISSHLVSQNELNKEYSDRLSDSLKDQREILSKFVDGFVNRMNDIFKQMESSVTSQISDFGEQQFLNSSEAIKDIVGKFTSTSANLLSEQQNSVERMISGTNVELQNISTAVTTNMGQMSSATITALENMRTSQQQKFESVISDQNAFYKGLNAQMEKQSKQAVDTNNEIVSQLKASMTGFIEEMQMSVRTNVEQLQKSYEFIDSHIAQIKSDYEQSALSFTDAVQNAHNSNDVFENTINSVDRSLQSVVDTNNKIEKVLDMLEQRQTNIDNLVSRIHEMSSAIESLQKLESIIHRLSK